MSCECCGCDCGDVGDYWDYDVPWEEFVFTRPASHVTVRPDAPGEGPK